MGEKYPSKQDIIIEVDSMGRQSTLASKENNKAKFPRVIRKRLNRHKRVGGGINFYDMGEYLEEGFWMQRDVLYNPTLEEFNAGQFSGGPNETILEKLNSPLALPRDLWKTYFRKIDYDRADRFRLVVRFDEDEDDDFEFITKENPSWTVDGLSKRPFTRLRLGHGTVDDKIVYYDLEGSLSPFDTSAPDGQYKVTSAPDYDSEAVLLDIKDSACDIFINPAVFTFIAESAHQEVNISTTAWADTDIGYYVYSFNGNCTQQTSGFQAQLRSVIDDRPSYTHYLNYFASHWDRNLMFNDSLFIQRDDYYTLEGDDNDVRDDQLNAMKLHYAARLEKRIGTYTDTAYEVRVSPEENVFPTYLIFCGTVPPSSTISNVSASQINPQSFNDAETTGLQFSNPVIVNHSLMAAINQDNKWFYIWRVGY